MTFREKCYKKFCDWLHDSDNFEEVFLCNEGDINGFTDCACCLGVPWEFEKKCSCICHKRKRKIFYYFWEEFLK